MKVRIYELAKQVLRESREEKTHFAIKSGKNTVWGVGHSEEAARKDAHETISDYVNKNTPHSGRDSVDDANRSKHYGKLSKYLKVHKVTKKFHDQYK